MKDHVGVVRCVVVLAALLGLVPIASGILPAVDPRAAAVGASNGYYEVFQYTGGVVNGGFAVATGPLHVITQTTLVPAPLPAPVSVVRVGTVMNGFAVRDYESRTDYLLPSLPVGPLPGWTNVVVASTLTPTLTPIGDVAEPTGWTARWDLAPVGSGLRLETTIAAVGDTQSSSAALVQLTVTNMGSSPARLGVRLRLDPDPVLESGSTFPGFGSAGPGLSLRPPCTVREPLEVVEQTWVAPMHHSWSAYGTMEPSRREWLYWMGATIAGPVGGGLPAPTAPDELQFAPEDTADLVDLRHSVFAAEHAVPPRIIADDYGGSSALNYLWGATDATALVLGPGEAREFRTFVSAWLEYPVSAALDAPVSVECIGGFGDADVDGSASTTIDGSPIRLEWEADAATVLTPRPPSRVSAMLAGLGAHDVTVHAIVGPYADCRTAVMQLVDTRPPRLDVPALVVTQTSRGAGGCQAPATVLAATTDDCAAASTEVVNSRTGATNDASGMYPLGDTDVTFTARDPSGHVATRVTTVRVIDDVGPRVSANVDPERGWPPNHGWLPIHVDLRAVDDCDPLPTVSLVRVVSSELPDGRADGRTLIDVLDADIGTADFDFLVRAERDGRDGGRSYVATYSVLDDAGNATDVSVGILVPHDHRRR